MHSAPDTQAYRSFVPYYDQYRRATTDQLFHTTPVVLHSTRSKVKKLPRVLLSALRVFLLARALDIQPYLIQKTPHRAVGYLNTER